MRKQKQRSGRSTGAPGNRPWMRLSGVAAVVAALGVGTVSGAHAGSLITGRQIKDNSLLSRDVRNGTLNGQDVRDGSLSAADFQGDTTGPDGNAGATGAAGQPGMHDVTIQESTLIQMANGEVRVFSVDCPPGSFAINGGLVDGFGVLEPLESAPDNDNHSWTIVVGSGATGATVRERVVCAQFNVAP